ncbi:hypothetical protein F0L17_00475 [Streptomyces sp. TRM43335]|uniref:Uncharacterized protein n=1 Tax=Streptomyces taklimakanensis TaxID=2569853 RepID=A0A6G2B6V0_9ACTN|nr:hypothetical protein [Streptomyces taklimakanensis]MTE17632.1 hypothetical protein [Streptomyces taklimakanensis]
MPRSNRLWARVPAARGEAMTAGPDAVPVAAREVGAPAVGLVVLGAEPGDGDVAVAGVPQEHGIEYRTRAGRSPGRSRSDRSVVGAGAPSTDAQWARIDP